MSRNRFNLYLSDEQLVMLENIQKVLKIPNNKSKSFSKIIEVFNSLFVENTEKDFETQYIILLNVVKGYEKQMIAVDEKSLKIMNEKIDKNFTLLLEHIVTNTGNTDIENEGFEIIGTLSDPNSITSNVYKKLDKQISIDKNKNSKRNLN